VSSAIPSAETRLLAKSPMPLVPLDSLDDPRLAPYRDLPHRKGGPGDDGGTFIAEGRLVVERLWQSPYRIASLLVANSHTAWAEDLLGTARRQTLAEAPPIAYALPDALINRLVGFAFHQGALACGLRTTPPCHAQAIADWYAPSTAGCERADAAHDRSAAGCTLVALPAMNSADNLGSLLRSARGLGAAGLVLGAQSADPLSRRAIRVSMGHALNLPLQFARDWLKDLKRLRAAGFRLIGCEHHPRMIPLCEAPRHPRQVLVFGHEFAGLDAATLEQLDLVVGIPMADGVDSLNVAVAAAIVLHHFTR
jgi:tRNA G18 (ribose-2'-O)-methylase SpoU